MNRLKKKQNGFTAIMVIIILVLFALIGTYMSTQVVTSSISTTLSLLSIKGWFAARSGTEWAIHQVLNNACTPFPASFSINDYDLVITCNPTAVSEGPDNYTIYDIVTTVQKDNPGDLTYISRTLRTSVTDAP